MEPRISITVRVMGSRSIARSPARSSVSSAIMRSKEQEGAERERGERRDKDRVSSPVRTDSTILDVFTGSKDM